MHFHLARTSLRRVRKANAYREHAPVEAQFQGARKLGVTLSTHDLCAAVREPGVVRVRICPIKDAHKPHIGAGPNGRPRRPNRHNKTVVTHRKGSSKVGLAHLDRKGKTGPRVVHEATGASFVQFHPYVLSMTGGSDTA